MRAHYESGCNEPQNQEGVFVKHKYPRTIQVLLVEDDPQLIALTEVQLKRLGCRVRSFINAVNAWDYFPSSPASFDLVITDQEMPRLTGTELAGKLASVRSDLPVVLYTGTFVDDRELRLSNVRKCVRKPIRSVAELRKVILSVIHNVNVVREI